MVQFASSFWGDSEPTQHQTFSMSSTFFQSIYLSWSQEKLTKKPFNKPLTTKIIPTTFGNFNAGITRWTRSCTHPFVFCVAAAEAQRTSPAWKFARSMCGFMTSSIPRHTRSQIMVQTKTGLITWHVPVCVCVSNPVPKGIFILFADGLSNKKFCMPNSKTGGSREFTVLLPTKTAVNTPWSRLRRQSVYLFL